MAKQGSILVVDDNKEILMAVGMLVERHFERVHTLSDPNQLLNLLAKERTDVVLLDMNFHTGVNNGNEGLYWLHAIKQHHPQTQVVLFTAYADIELAVRGIKEGAVDFIVKPFDNAKLLETLQKACSNQPVTRPQDTSESPMFWGESEAMQHLRLLVEKVASTHANILITGENGTGKEMLAREIYRQSNRREEAWVAVDMGAITETLFESELFGHVKGAFTDARSDRPGKFEAANHGTLFLDEIGNLSYHLQAKLLTVLQRRSVTRVGSNQPIPIDIRLISATNRDLPALVQKQQFREDLLYRLNTIHLEIPPLRKRTEDIVPLAEIFLAKYATRYAKPKMHLSDEAARLLQKQPWWGNIRELEHTLEKAVIISDGPEINPHDFEFAPAPDTEPVAEQPAMTLEQMEYQMIKEAIRKFEGNLSLVANQLGISRQTLYNKIKRYGL
ncbi:MAG: sigma-54-dependent transcriptional regulator [Parabacteroides sp.]